MLHNHTIYPLSENELRMVKAIPAGGNWKNIPLDIPSKRLEQIRKSGGRTTLYGRLALDKPSYTITTYFNRLGNGTYVHPLYNRMISAREAARFQSFPDSYVFLGSKTSLCKQIGNAVPPLLAFVIAQKIKKETKTKNVLDLFCGSGGLSLGFGWAGYNIVVANDNFQQACDTYEFNHKETNLIRGDITDNKIQNAIIKSSKNGKVDIIIGGPPCQGFSHAGKRIIDDPRNSLYKEFVNMVKKLKPKVFLMENVEGIITINNGKTFDEIKDNFSELGYKVVGRKIKAVEFGVPQKRKRVIIIGTLKNNTENCFPDPIIKDENGFINTKDAIEDLLGIDVNNGFNSVPLEAEPTSSFQKFARGLIQPNDYITSLG